MFIESIHILLVLKFKNFILKKLYFAILKKSEFAKKFVIIFK